MIPAAIAWPSWLFETWFKTEANYSNLSLHNVHDISRLPVGLQKKLPYWLSIGMGTVLYSTSCACLFAVHLKKFWSWKFSVGRFPSVRKLFECDFTRTDSIIVQIHRPIKIWRKGSTATFFGNHPFISRVSDVRWSANSKFCCILRNDDRRSWWWFRRLIPFVVQGSYSHYVIR